MAPTGSTPPSGDARGERDIQAGVEEALRIDVMRCQQCRKGLCLAVDGTIIAGTACGGPYTIILTALAARSAPPTNGEIATTIDNALGDLLDDAPELRVELIHSLARLFRERPEEG